MPLTPRLLSSSHFASKPCSLCSLNGRHILPIEIFSSPRTATSWSFAPACKADLQHRPSAYFAGFAQRSRSRRIAAGAVDAEGRTASVGDTVTVHFTVIGEDGEKLESSRDSGQPLTFEVGASDIIGNDLLQAFDGGVRGLAVGTTRRVQLEPLQEEWSQDLLFPVPRDHQEVLRLEGKFRSAGGLQEGMIVELANGAQAQVLKITDEAVVFDANSATAGRKVAFDIELVSIE